MKKLLLVISSLLIIYCVYFDLRTGTLPINKVASVSENVTKNVKLEKKNNTEYVEVKVKPGDTVLSLLEKQLEGKLPVSITKVVKDFKTLNKVEPEKIQIGKTYKIPLY